MSAPAPAADQRADDAGERIVAAPALAQWTAGVLAALGVSAADAELVADTLVQADLRGVHSHGVQRIPGYVQQLQAGTIVADAQPEVVHRTASTAVLDAHHAMGQVAAHAAMRLALESAAEVGQGAVAIRNSTHCGALAYFAMMAPPAGCIGFAATNAGMNMLPWGGQVKMVGNNPLAYAIPTGRGFPLVLDMATSVVAGGKLDVAILRGEAIPVGWALGPDGQPATDPAVARAGSLLPIGGPKGYGLAVVLDILSGVLAGGRFGGRLGAAGSSHFVQALRIDAFTPAAEFLERMGALVDQIHDCPRAPERGSYLPTGRNRARAECAASRGRHSAAYDAHQRANGVERNARCCPAAPLRSGRAIGDRHSRASGNPRPSAAAGGP